MNARHSRERYVGSDECENNNRRNDDNSANTDRIIKGNDDNVFLFFLLVTVGVAVVTFLDVSFTIDLKALILNNTVLAVPRILTVDT